MIFGGPVVGGDGGSSGNAENGGISGNGGNGGNANNGGVAGNGGNGGDVYGGGHAGNGGNGGDADNGGHAGNGGDGGDTHDGGQAGNGGNGGDVENGGIAGNGGNGGNADSSGGNQGSHPTTTSTPTQAPDTETAPSPSTEFTGTSGTFSASGTSTSATPSESPASQPVAVGSSTEDITTEMDTSTTTQWANASTQTDDTVASTAIDETSAADPSQPELSPVPPEAKSSTLSPGAIAGIVVGTLAVLAILVALFIYLRRRKRASQQDIKRHDPADMAQVADYYGIEPYMISAAMASSHGHDASSDSSEALPSPISKKHRQGFQRQRDLQEQMRRLQQEVSLFSDPRTSHNASPVRTPSDAGSLLQRLRAAEERIAILQAQTQSSMSLGYDDEVPPRYARVISRASTASSTTALQSHSNVNFPR
jgi:hypothetical protein